MSGGPIHVRSVLARFIVLLFVLFMIALALTARREDTLTADLKRVTDQMADYGRVERMLRESIDRVGPDYVRGSVDEVASGLDVSSAHVLAHAFGEALYKSVGLEGFAMCDEKFSYGCTHQFVGLAISDRGPPVVEDLARLCTERFGPTAIGCGHAMGHGIEGYYGYTLKDLHVSIPLCAAFKTEVTQEKCLTGVFMEYNLRGLETTGEAFARVRPFSDGNPFEPCDTLEGIYGRMCYHQLPLWWTNSTKWRDLDGMFEASGERCRALYAKGDAFAEYCFMGVGLAAAVATNLDTTFVDEMCGVATASRREHLLCISEALFKYRIAGTHGSERLCELFDFDEPGVEECRERVLR